MPVSTIVTIAAAVAAFAVFAAVLASVQLQTRHLTGASAPAVSRPRRRAF